MNQIYPYINLEAIRKDLDRYFSNFKKGKFDYIETEDLLGRYQSAVQTVFESWRLSNTLAWITDISSIKNYNIEISRNISFDPKKYEIRTNSISFLLEREGIDESKWNS